MKNLCCQGNDFLKTGDETAAGTTSEHNVENRPENDQEVAEQSSDLQAEFAEMVGKFKKPPLIIKSTNNTRKQVELEWTTFKSTGHRVKYLSKVYNALLTIQVSSTESERCFSRARYFANKFRGNFRDDTLSALTFLFLYFKKAQVV